MVKITQSIVTGLYVCFLLFSVAVKIVMDTKVACLLFIILGALTVQRAVSVNKRMNPLHARQWRESECSSVALMTPHVVKIIVVFNCVRPYSSE